jgi:hypothetical protein
MSKERVGFVSCMVLLAAVTGVSLAKSLSLKLAKQDLKEEIDVLNQKVTELTAAPAPVEPVDVTPEPVPIQEPLPAATPDQAQLDFREELLAAQEDINLLEARLRDRNMVIDDLQAKLKERDDRLTALSSRRNRRQDYMENLKKEDPERYEQMLKERQDFQERLAENAVDQHDFLSKVDVSSWPSELQENHAKVLETVAKITEVLRQPSDSEESRGTRREMFRQFRDTMDMFEKERSMLLYDAAQQIGFDNEGSREFVDYVETINDVTSPRALFRRGARPQQQEPEAAAETP